MQHVMVLCVSQERPKSAVFPAEVKSKMTVEEQNERIRRNQSSSVRDKRRSINLSSSQNIDGYKSSTNYRVVSVILHTEFFSERVTVIVRLAGYQCTFMNTSSSWFWDTTGKTLEKPLIFCAWHFVLFLL